MTHGLGWVARSSPDGCASPRERSIAIVFARAAIAALLLGKILRARGEPMLPLRAPLGPLAAMGFVGVALHGVLQAHALTLTTLVNTRRLIPSSRSSRSLSPAPALTFDCYLAAADYQEACRAHLEGRSPRSLPRHPTPMPSRG